MLVLLFPFPASALLDLAAARVSRLDNGLILIVLEDHTLPVVSVQMLYRVGARNEITGATGLAHFLEHMAFRSTKNFPDTQVVSSIYAAGGEWHGYTWLDQTTYFATAPSQELDLLLRIESDRMARLDIAATDVPAQRGAVLAEMHGYENDPMTVLQDHVLYLVFLAHPYRNNTIGWETDVERISHADLLDFYRRYYQPGNAILAVVGDIRTDQVKQLVQREFGSMPGRPAAPAPPTVEPAQTGERRIYLRGSAERKYFKIAYRAPAVTDSGFAAFLLVQELLAGGSGVSFLQNDWGTPVHPGKPLAGITDDLTTWFPPSAQDYVFIISGSAPADAGESMIEIAVESGIRNWRQGLSADDGAMADALEQAKENVLRALLFDVETTEDAAHQLAFFTGLDALDVLTGLPHAIRQVEAGDVDLVMERYLQSSKRTIGWFTPAGTQTAPAAEPFAAEKASLRAGAASTAAHREKLPAAAASAGVAPEREPMGTAVVTQLDNGLPVILQRSSLSATVNLKVLTPATAFPMGISVTPDQPIRGISSLDFALLPDELAATVSQASTALRSAEPSPPDVGPFDSDPALVLQRCFEDILGLKAAPVGRPGAPVLLVVSGDIDPAQVIPLLQAGFGGMEPAVPGAPVPAAKSAAMDIEITLAQARAQEQLAYVVQAPAPGTTDADAWQMALYILSHGYEGRLGKQAISRRGLIYHIDSDYHGDGGRGWITLDMGVDPAKLTAMKAVLRQELNRLVQEPPTRREVEEARQHLLGRHVSAAQSNRELGDELARQWLWYGHVYSVGELENRLGAVRRQDIIAMLPSFTAGTTVAVRNPRSDGSSGPGSTP